jgi:hypothetical protein
MKFSINLTWSKIIALLILISGVGLDYIGGGNSSFMYALPFVSALVLGKQGISMVEKLKAK